MVDLKPEKKQDEDTSIKIDRGFKFRHLLLFILGSAIAHGGLFLFFAQYKPIKVAEEKQESKPIEFVVVPPEEKSEEPPPETNNRAAENSIANKENIQPEKTAPNEKIVDEPAKTPPPAPAPVPTPKPTPEPLEKVTSEPTPEPSSQDLISGSDAPISPPQEEETVATAVPPQPESIPETSSSEGSAADLLGGDYKKTLADGGGEAFFSPEALTHKTVLNPGQIDALRDVDLTAYFAEIKKRVKRNWNPSYSSQEQTTYLTFNVQKNGQITDLVVTESSGSKKLDRESVAAVQNSGPFDPLPPDFPLEALEIEFSFNIYLY